MKARAILTIMIFLLSAATSAWGVGIEAAVGVWNHDPHGDFSFEGDNLSFEDDLKYSDKTRFTGRLNIDMPLMIPNIYLMATQMEFEGDGSKSGGFTFADATFSGASFHSKFSLSHYDVALYYGIPLLKTVTWDVLNIDLGINGRVIDFDGEFNQSSTGINENVSKTYMIPMGFAAIQVRPLDWLSLEGEARGITYDGNQYYDLIGRGKILFLDHLFVAGGYRYEKIFFDRSEVKADLEFSGPFAEAGIQF